MTYPELVQAVASLKTVDEATVSAVLLEAGRDAAQFTADVMAAQGKEPIEGGDDDGLVPAESESSNLNDSDDTATKRHG